MKVDDNLTLKIKRSWIVYTDRKGVEVIKLYFARVFDIPEDCKIENLSIPTIHILRLYISPEYRRMGYGTKLMELLFENNKRIKDFIVVANPDDDTEESRKWLLKFYESFGFKKVCEEDEGTLMHCKRNG